MNNYPEYMNLYFDNNQNKMYQVKCRNCGHMDLTENVVDPSKYLCFICKTKREKFPK